ncbi:hypothetical protein [Muricoccus vinaceus]|uniref:Uncharacterized protein n=1 Tax=Muricoccus vinaceus TaxID=424704 RepID=A0ABV6ITZ6_9PROT
MPRTLKDIRRLLSRSVLLTLLWFAWPISAEADPGANLCTNRVIVSYVYTVMLSQGIYEHRAYLRNRTRYTLAWTMSLGSLGEGVTLPLEYPVHGVLAPHAGETLRIGRGSDATIGLNTIEVLYDQLGEARPFLSVHTCIAKTR